MAADKNKIAADSWRRGNEALDKANWDYAINMYRQSAKLVPDNKLYRETLRGASEKKYGNNGTGARLASAKLMGIRTKIKKAKMTKDWPSVDVLAEDGLTVNPWDPQLNTDLAEACAARAEQALEHGNESSASGFQSIAIYSYLRALQATPMNKEWNRNLARLYEDRRDYRAAIACWERIHKADPLDAEARSKVNQLSAEQTMMGANFEDATSTRELMEDHEVAKRIKSGHEVADGPGMSLEADLERAVRKEPDNKDAHLKLGDYYARGGRLDDAIERYKAALKLSGGDANIREKLEDIELKKFARAVRDAKEAATKNPTEETRLQARKLETDLVKREVEILTAREERYPSDMRLKLELATRLMRFKKWSAAIPRLQKAVTDIRLRGEALVRLGICFSSDQKPQLARHQLEQALTEVNHDSNPKMYKEMLYRLARICEDATDFEPAEKYYSQLLAVDYGFKDAVNRLEKIQSRRK